MSRVRAGHSAGPTSIARTPNAAGMRRLDDIDSCICAHAAHSGQHSRIVCGPWRVQHDAWNPHRDIGIDAQQRRREAAEKPAYPRGIDAKDVRPHHQRRLGKPGGKLMQQAKLPGFDRRKSDDRLRPKLQDVG